MCFFALRHFFPLRPQVFPRALGSVARREPARTQHPSVGPSRGPWRVLLGFIVASLLGEGFRARGAVQVHANPRTKYIKRLKNVQRLMRYLGFWTSSMASDITYLLMEKGFPRHQQARHATMYIILN